MYEMKRRITNLPVHGPTDAIEQAILIRENVILRTGVNVLDRDSYQTD
jgi:hypothetical protein